MPNFALSGFLASLGSDCRLVESSGVSEFGADSATLSFWLRLDLVLGWCGAWVSRVRCRLYAAFWVQLRLVLAPGLCSVRRALSLVPNFAGP